MSGQITTSENCSANEVKSVRDENGSTVSNNICIEENGDGAFANGSGTLSQLKDFKLDPTSPYYAGLHDAGFDYASNQPGPFLLVDSSMKCRPGSGSGIDIGAFESDPLENCVGGPPAPPAPVLLD